MPTADETPRSPKILIFDIETSPNIGYTWGKYDQNVIEFLQEWHILCFAWKWLGRKKIHGAKLPDYDLYSNEPQNDLDLTVRLWELFDEADVLIAHNGRRFDIKKANSRFLVHGLKPPTPYKVIDTLTIARRHFRFNSNKLDDLGDMLGVGRKLQHSGFAMWKGTMEGDTKSWDQMMKYNIQDIDLLEKVYLKLRPWILGHPNLNLLQETELNCPNCGSWRLHRRGFSTTRVSKMQRYQCQECGAWSKSPLGKIVR